MTDGILEFTETYLPQIVGIGVAAGGFMSGFSILLGYMVSKIQGFFDN